MTIQITGHVERVERALNGKVAVTVYLLSTDVAKHQGDEFPSWTFYVAEKNAAHWTPGRCVQATLFAFDGNPSLPVLAVEANA